MDREETKLDETKYFAPNQRWEVDLTWSELKPEIPGFYWYRTDPLDKEPDIIHLWQNWKNEWMVDMLGFQQMARVEEYPGQFAGPIEPPE